MPWCEPPVRMVRLHLTQSLPIMLQFLYRNHVTPYHPPHPLFGDDSSRRNIETSKERTFHRSLLVFQTRARNGNEITVKILLQRCSMHPQKCEILFKNISITYFLISFECKSFCKRFIKDQITRNFSCKKNIDLNDSETLQKFLSVSFRNIESCISDFDSCISLSRSETGLLSTSYEAE